MKYLVTIMLFLPLLTACSSHNAFYNFKMSKPQELSEDSISSSKIYNKDQTDGLIAAIYLNTIFPKKYNKHEYFYVYMYVKNSSSQVQFMLNAKKPLHITKLAPKNSFSEFLSFSAVWADYYLLEFSHQESENLILEAKTAHFSSNKLQFEKSE